MIFEKKNLCEQNRITDLSKMFQGETEDCRERAPKPTINIENSLLIIKPDAMHKAREIEDIILKSGFTVINVCYIIYV